MKKKIFIAIAAFFFVAVASVNVMVSSDNANVGVTALIAKAGWDQTWQAPHPCSGCGDEYCYDTHGIYTYGWREIQIGTNPDKTPIMQLVPYNECNYITTNQKCY